MTARNRSALLFLICLLTACASGRLAGTPSSMPALSTTVLWETAEMHAGIDAAGRPVDVVRLRGGEIVRLDVSNAAVSLGERNRAADGAGEVWSDHVARDGVVVLRAGPFTEELLVAQGTVAHARIGRGRDPGYGWFDLEDRVMSWAAGPLRAPFPSLAPPQRIDSAAFAQLDAVLAVAIDNALDAQGAMVSAQALRRVVGLRTVRALRPASGYPYFVNTAPAPLHQSPSRISGEHLAYEVTPERPLELSVEGPALLYVTPEVAADVSGRTIELRAWEGGRLRASSATKLLSNFSSPAEPNAGEGRGTRKLERALVHVPPGLHSYSITANAPLFAVPWLARPVVHWEDAALKSEDSQLRVARTACDRHDIPVMCAMALALLGEDARPSSVGSALDWRSALARSSEEARRVIESLAAGGPRDPLQALEMAASSGDASALQRLARFTDESVDDATRSRWVRAMARGTSWKVADHERDGARWVALTEAPDAVACGAPGADGWPEVSSAPQEFVTSLWHGTPTLELVVATSCADATPVELEVDGTKIIGSPLAALAHWHVRVHGEGAQVRRLDHGAGRVYAIAKKPGACTRRWEALHAPRRASERPTLQFPGLAAWALPGVEVWLRDGVSSGVVTLAPKTAASESRAVRIAVQGSGKLTALDGQAGRWRLVAKVALPTWASSGIVADGPATVALRAIGRVATREITEGEPATPTHANESQLEADEAAAVALSRRILSTELAQRGPLHLQRALLLAAGGAARAALSDAQRAEQLGTRGPGGETPSDLARAAFRARSPEVEPLPSEVTAYGVEVDFDAQARACQAPGTGARAELQRVATELTGANDREAAGAATYDPALGARTMQAVQLCPLDPRGPALLSRALRGSRWKLKSDVAGAVRHVLGPVVDRAVGPVDHQGELRPRVATGAPFEEGSYVTVSAGHPAQAVVVLRDGAARVSLDLACAPREALAEEATCPIELQIGGAPTTFPTMASDGRATLALALPLNEAATLAIRLRPAPGHWIALARVRFDRPAPDTVSVPGVGWVLAPHTGVRRAIVRPGESLTVKSRGAAMFRLDAVDEAHTGAQAVVDVNGTLRVLRTDGTELAVPMPEGGTLSVRVPRGEVSVALAERVVRDDVDEEIGGVWPTAEAAPEESAIDPRLHAPIASWMSVVERSPRPLTRIEASLGTFVGATGVVVGTLREGAPSLPAADGYAFAIMGYRRRSEWLHLWTDFEGFVRTRNGPSTLGGTAGLYEDIDAYHVRLSATFSLEAQRVRGVLARSVRSRGFAEYSWRASDHVFILPRLGYDNVTSSLRHAPAASVEVDDEVYNSYRFHRPTFIFGQVLFWYAPHFNDIFYVRSRVSIDAAAGWVSHGSLRPGLFLATGDLDLTASADVTTYTARDSRLGRAHSEVTGALVARYDFWSHLGSLCIQPGLALYGHAVDRGWQINAFISVLGSYRRGLRDFSSLELDFPEQRGGGVPWRGSSP